MSASTSQFRLAVPLKLRRLGRDRCRLRLAETLAAGEALERRIAELSLEQSQSQSEQRRIAEPGMIRLDQLAEIARYAGLLRTAQAGLHVRHEALDAETARRRQTLVEADRDARSLEQLEERHNGRRRQAAQRHESQELDEAALRTAKNRYSEE